MDYCPTEGDSYKGTISYYLIIIALYKLESVHRESLTREFFAKDSTNIIMGYYLSRKPSQMNREPGKRISVPYAQSHPWKAIYVQVTRAVC